MVRSAAPSVQNARLRCDHVDSRAHHSRRSYGAPAHMLTARYAMRGRSGFDFRLGFRIAGARVVSERARSRSAAVVRCTRWLP
jgi:hypothetical protein